MSFRTPTFLFWDIFCCIKHLSKCLLRFSKVFLGHLIGLSVERELILLFFLNFEAFFYFRHLRSLLQLKEISAHLRIQQMDSRLLPQLQLPWPKVGQGVMSSEQWLTSYGTLLQLKSFTRYVWNSDWSKSCDCAFCIVMAYHVKLTCSCIQKNYSVQCTLNVMLSYYDKLH